MSNDTKTQIAQLRQEIEKQDKIIVPADSPIAAELKSKQVPYEEQPALSASKRPLQVSFFDMVGS